MRKKLIILFLITIARISEFYSQFLDLLLIEDLINEVIDKPPEDIRRLIRELEEHIGKPLLLEEEKDFFLGLDNISKEAIRETFRRIAEKNPREFLEVLQKL